MQTDGQTQWVLPVWISDQGNQCQYCGSGQHWQPEAACFVHVVATRSFQCRLTYCCDQPVHYQYDNRDWFVLQNSHQGGFFKVVDAEYFASCLAIVTYAGRKTDMSLQHKFKLEKGEYIECLEVPEFMEECVEDDYAEGYEGV